MRARGRRRGGSRHSSGVICVLEMSLSGAATSSSKPHIRPFHGCCDRAVELRAQGPIDRAGSTASVHARCRARERFSPWRFSLGGILARKRCGGARLVAAARPAYNQPQQPKRGHAMLKHEDNEKISRVGPGTPMGNLMRRYWQPAALSSELPERDGAPIRVRLLGEDLIAFRDSDGKVGLVDAYCPHRRAPMFFGRNEECGLRCVYHGWKFDADGTCVDMPSEPPTRSMKNEGHDRSLSDGRARRRRLGLHGPEGARCRRRPTTNGCARPRRIATSRRRSRIATGCRRSKAGSTPRTRRSCTTTTSATSTLLRKRDGAPRLEVEPTDYGYYYVSTRKPASPTSTTCASTTTSCRRSRCARRDRPRGRPQRHSEARRASLGPDR